VEKIEPLTSTCRSIPLTPNQTTNSVVFQPPDEVKGDVARIIFYMYTRYSGLTLSDNPSGGSEMGRLDDLLEWHTQDPVSASERNRNDGACTMQLNRNPFVDHPCLVGQIFGRGVASCNTPTKNPVAGPVVTPPVHATSLLISQYLEGSSNYKAIQVRNVGAFATYLDSFSLRLYFNGATSSGAVITFPTGATLDAGATFTVCNSALAGQDFCDAFTANVKMNGNDVVALTSSSDASDVYDIVGTIGVNPSGGGFNVCSTSAATKDHTLVRSESVTAGNGGQWEGNNGCSDWNVHDLNNWVSVGAARDAKVLELTADTPDTSTMSAASLASIGVGAIAVVGVGSVCAASKFHQHQKKRDVTVTAMSSSPSRVSICL
jgi:hypothetical protein